MGSALNLTDVPLVVMIRHSRELTEDTFYINFIEISIYFLKLPSMDSYNIEYLTRDDYSEYDSTIVKT